MAPTTCVLIPYRESDDGGRRARLMHWTTGRLRDQHPTWGIVLGAGPDDGPFNRSAAINEAAAVADDHPRVAATGRAADVFVIADADSVVGPDALRSAVEVAHATGKLTFAFERFAALGRAMSDLVLDGYDGDWEPGVEWDVHGSCSSMVVVPRSLWETVDGFDPGFVGWGFEDVAFSLACQALRPPGGVPFHRVAGTVWHLSHPPAPATGDDRHPIWRANAARCDAYKAAWADGPGAMRALIDERRVRA